MPKSYIKALLIIFSGLAVGYPLLVAINTRVWALDNTILWNLFPLFGILGFTLLWLHAISGVFESWLRQQIDFDKFVHITASIILISIIMHPLLLLVAMGENFLEVFTWGKYIWFGTIGWVLLITYDIGKFLKRKYDFFVRNWRNILIISNIGFILTFFHSINIGQSLQTSPLRPLWIFYGITAIIAIIYTYGLKIIVDKLNHSDVEKEKL